MIIKKNIKWFNDFQRISNEKMYEQEVADNGDKVEVFIKFNTPLSPIPEESFSESNSCQYSPHQLV